MTTLNQIRSHSPCTEGWAKLLKHIGKTTADDEPLSLLTVLDSNGWDDAIWCLRTEATPERTQRFALAVARRVEHHHPQAKATLDIVERYLNGTATKAELAELDAADYAARSAARSADYAARSAARSAAYAAYAAAADAAAHAAHAAAYTAAYAAAADAAERKAHAAAYTAAYTADAAADATERKAQVQIFKGIFA